MSSKFSTLNTRAAKVNGEQVMWIRRQYAAMRSYPAIREELQRIYGVTMSIQQITRIAKGHSFAQLPTVPTEREVDLTMHTAARDAVPASEDEIARSLEKFQADLVREAHRESVEDILRNRAATLAPIPLANLDELEAREKAVLGAQQGGLDKLIEVASSGTAEDKDQDQVTVKLDGGKLLETLTNERDTEILPR